MQVNNKVWVITGGGSGIGQALALHLLEKGARVAIVDIQQSGMQETLRLAGDKNSQLSTHLLNITEQEAVQALPQEVIEAHGQIDGLINNAGIIQPFVRVSELDFTAIERVLQVNLYGPLYMIKAFMPHLQGRSEAHLVNISSMGGFVPVPGQTIYGASKAAIKLLTEGLYSELQDSPVRVTAVFPGAVATNISSNSGVATPSQEEAQTEESSFRALPASRAAEIIVKGIEKNQYHILVGRDARFMYLMSRLAPKRAAQLIYQQMKALLQ
jgi:short-subunit dehydrogenase